MNNPAVIIPGDRPATLGIARSLGRRGIRVIVVDTDPHVMGSASKFSEFHRISENKNTPESRIHALIELGKSLPEKAVLFPVSDFDVILCSEERSTLERYFISVFPDHPKLEDLLKKDGLHKVAEKCGIESPALHQVHKESDIDHIADGLTFPVILKPIFSNSWLLPEIVSLLKDHPLSNPPKVALCNNAQELRSKYREIAKYDPRMIIQEVIPGEDWRLYYACFYLNRDSKVLAFFAGQKLRTLPVGFGSGTYVRSIDDKDLRELSIKLLHGSQYKGLGGVEFKKDPRDGNFKLIEFNARFGLWDSLSIKCGVDLPYIAYRDALHLPVDSKQIEYRKEVFWIDFERDFRAFLIYRKQGLITFWEWIKSFRGELMWSVFSITDIKPSVISIASIYDRVIARLQLNR